MRLRMPPEKVELPTTATPIFFALMTPPDALKMPPEKLFKLSTKTGPNTKRQPPRRTPGRDLPGVADAAGEHATGPRSEQSSKDRDSATRPGSEMPPPLRKAPLMTEMPPGTRHRIDDVATEGRGADYHARTCSRQKRPDRAPCMPPRTPNLLADGPRPFRQRLNLIAPQALSLTPVTGVVQATVPYATSRVNSVRYTRQIVYNEEPAALSSRRRYVGSGSFATGSNQYHFQRCPLFANSYRRGKPLKPTRSARSGSCWAVRNTALPPVEPPTT